MRLTALVAIPLVGGVLVCGAGALLGGSEDLWFTTQLVCQLVGLAGCVAAAAVLGRRDFMLRAWLLTGAAFGVQIAWRVVFGPGMASWGPSSAPEWVGTTFILGVNGAAVGGALLFVVAFVRVGLLLQGWGRRFAADMAVFAVVAAGLGAPTLLVMLPQAPTPLATFEAMVLMAGDVACFLLVAPLWRISRVFAGGALAWPWAFLAVANLGYLLYDATLVLGRVGDAAGTASPVRWVAEGLYAASAGAIAAAGLAHRRAVLLTRTERHGA